MMPTMPTTPMIRPGGPAMGPPTGPPSAPSTMKVPQSSTPSSGTPIPKDGVLRIPSHPGFTNPKFGNAIQEFLTKCDTTPNYNVQLTVERIKRMVDGDQEITADPTRLDGYVMSGKRPTGRVVQNFMGSDGLKFASMLTNNAPEAKVVPSDPDDLYSVTSAETAQDVLDAWWKEVDIIQHEVHLANTFWRAGTCYTHVFLRVTDNLIDVERPDLQEPQETTGPADLYNEMEVDPNAMVEAMLNGPTNPIDAEIEPMGKDNPHTLQSNLDVERVQEYTVGLHVTDAREVTVPIRETEVEKLPWLRFDQEVFTGRIIQDYGVQSTFLTNSKAYNDSGGDKLPSVNIQPTSLRLSTDALTNRKDAYEVLTKLWISPVSYPILNDEHHSLFTREFPDGAVVHICRSRVLRISHGRIQDNWVITSPDMDRRMVVKPKALDIESTQLALNTSTNYGIRILHRGVPTTLVDSTLISAAGIASQRNQAYDILRVNAGGRDLARMVGNLPTGALPKELVPFMTLLRANSQEIDGITPPIFGAGAPASTFREGESRRNAAMGQSKLTFSSHQRWKREVAKAALNLKARFGVQDLKVANKSKIRVHYDLKVDGWNVEVAPEIPTSDIETADSLREIFNQNTPELLTALEITSPANRSRVHQLLKLKGFKSTAADSDAYCQMVLEGLLTKPAEVDAQSGLLYPPERPNLDIEDPQEMMEYMISWVKSPTGGLITRKRNKEGYQNVMRYVALYKIKLQQQQMEQAMQQQQMGLPPGEPPPQGGSGAGAQPPPQGGGTPGPPPEPQAPPEPGGRPTTAPTGPGGPPSPGPPQ